MKENVEYDVLQFANQTKLECLTQKQLQYIITKKFELAKVQQEATLKLREKVAE